ncbi:hypothetical protein [Halomonas sp. Mc5H-6]|uniref:hypothetical protein n=1 Tax=Halomonas sp. Mc5H-6 TaxID=2954500 RepID=UPI002097DA14|nr:hypothetical protein [Halomonas sp. Mc5H-6]MCO7247962.1 hypothetical protein [Halomonas sp. Mc5H-6]
MGTIIHTQTGAALKALEKGDSEPLAQLFEEGSTFFLHEYIRDSPDDCERIARVIRGKKARGRGRKAPQERDEYLLARVCYWLGKGASKWQDSAEDTAFHKARKDADEAGWKGYKSIESDTLKNLWYDRNPGTLALMHMGAAFSKGCLEAAEKQEDKHAFFHQKVEQAKSIGIPSQFYGSQLIEILVHEK